MDEKKQYYQMNVPIGTSGHGRLAVSRVRSERLSLSPSSTSPPSSLTVSSNMDGSESSQERQSSRVPIDRMAEMGFPRPAKRRARIQTACERCKTRKIKARIRRRFWL